MALWDRVPDAAERVHIGSHRCAPGNGGPRRPLRSGRTIRRADRTRAVQIQEREDPIRAGLLHARLGFFRWLIGESQAMIDEYHRAMALIPAEPPTVERARVVGVLAGALMPTGHYRESRELCEEAIATLRAAGSQEGEARLLMVLGVDLVGLGETDAGLDVMRRAVEIAREAGPPETLLTIQHNLAFFLVQTDRFEEGLEVDTRALEDARRGRSRAPIRGRPSRQRRRHPRPLRPLGRSRPHDPRRPGAR